MGAIFAILTICWLAALATWWDQRGGGNGDGGG